ncbi:TPA: DUF1501 domain-containing protein [Photobacterium damselae]|uniref:DUF1501 domain-containing protein n=1 Tax=Photobacterium damselae TaxID=38293 RepID=UPI00083ACEE0|nr:DUF1501 domain-containing protein [Photobacterium damselae]AWK81835.1 hypothetical protein BST98_07105 [Photobacterium damselae]KAB1182736.1 DUF1501 domain-containing protein [Photobacterium damselae subsp. damselae]ODA26462.1 hypothetical protein A0J46_03615 [Photobacterium damselae subsp. damselae]TLS68833.1 DUF1501 domain-containing protein [Photobacterium damselae subsp. damselae]
MKISRRRFLQSAAAVSATSASVLPNIALASSSISDYKALVVVFLYGGNDAYNMIVPTSPDAYQSYLSARPALGLTQSEILPLSLHSENQISLGIHSAMSDLLPLFESGQASVLLNTGQLLTPATRSTIAAGLSPLPEFLMAHNMQQDMWQTGATNYNNSLGWAGRMMDMLASNTSISPLISLNSQRRFNSAKNLSQTVISSQGVGQYSSWHDSVRLDEYFAHFKADYDNVYTQHFANTMKKSVSENTELKNVLDAHPSSIVYPDSKLATQLQMVARMISARQSLGHQRQVFFVGIGGFDTHFNQKPTHHALLQQLAQALALFQQDLEQQGVTQNVTTVTMSDFGRRVMANESGTDHGWAGHQLILGGAIKGQKAYGTWPDLTPGSENDYNNGRMIPTIAADQVHATLCRWFGLSDQQILELFPNLINFKSPYIDCL